MHVYMYSKNIACHFSKRLPTKFIYGNSDKTEKNLV